MTVSVTGLFVLCFFGTGTDPKSLTVHTELSNPQKSGARLFFFPVEMEGVEVVEEAEVFGLAVVLIFCPCVTDGCGFIGFLILIALDILLLPDETLDVLTVCRCLILSSPR